MMIGLKTLLPLLLLLSTTTSTALPTLEERGSTTCGSTYYTASEVNAAFSAGYEDYQDGDEPDDYPHTYKNYEGFDFPVDGPYQEFPLVSGGVYTGGSPGADRVVFSTSGELAGEITHTGASGDDFVGCSGTS
ncbi:Guanyl-specific ribonuclease F1 [Lachnellula arida]|uniref:ribonuclease T1 n=1 Tax=Lachnellula arida TaxID=1316785 RepID=A0A8T9BP09_9HELO|nr:Guanyl-specific ribonuclease F1 [Lachnellula arida]